MTRLLLLWDVDHTLIQDGGVNEESYALAYELLTGAPPEEWIFLHGRTERDVLDQLLVVNGRDPATYPWPDQARALVDAVARNAEPLARRGSRLPGAEEALSAVADRPGVVQSTLTGNVVENARVKLGVFALDPWIDFEVGAYGSDSLVRADLVPVAQAKAAAKYGFDPRAAATVLVGDTPRDVQAGLVGGAWTVGVGTGMFTAAELRSAGADAVFDDLSDLPGFLAAVDELAGRGPTGPRPVEGP